MNVTVSNLVWLPRSAFTPQDYFVLKKTLTIVPKVMSYGQEDKPSPVIYCYRETDDLVGIPRAFYLKNKRPFHQETIAVSEGAVMRDLPAISLRDDQEPVAQKVVAHLNAGPFAGGLIEAFTSFGKTVCAIEIARRIGRTTFILVHKDPLAQQWIQRIQQFLPGARVGLVQGDKVQFEGMDFVICMIQSLAGDNGNKYPDAMWRAAGLVIADEVHRLGAPWFSTAMPRFYARRMLGLSATMKRSDGCDPVFKWTIGDVIAKPVETNKVKPVIYVRRTGFKASWEYRKKETNEVATFDLNEFQKPTVLKFICKNKHRNALIAKDIINALAAGRVPLIIAERLDVLYTLGSLVAKACTEQLHRGCQVGYYIGGLDEEQRSTAAKADVICATMQLAKEGIDIQRLDTLFIVTPISDPVQLIGRIGRPQTVRGSDGVMSVIQPKHRPMVVDYVDDDVKKFKGLFMSRMQHYSGLGLEIIGMKL